MVMTVRCAAQWQQAVQAHFIGQGIRYGIARSGGSGLTGPPRPVLIRTVIPGAAVKVLVMRGAEQVSPLLAVSTLCSESKHLSFRPKLLRFVNTTATASGMRESFSERRS
jgi:hypothetical protein